MERDSRGNLYEDVGNIRLTYVPASTREAALNWSGQDVVRIQAYRGDQDRSLHPGAEFPASDPHAFVELLGALCRLYAAARPAGADAPTG